MKSIGTLPVMTCRASVDTVLYALATLSGVLILFVVSYHIGVAYSRIEWVTPLKYSPLHSFWPTYVRHDPLKLSLSLASMFAETGIQLGV